jgi:hypothetical protein
MSSGTPVISSQQGREENLASIIGASAYGEAIRRVLGSGRVPGNLVWAGTPVEHVTVDEQRQGKGGGGVTTRTETYWYTCSFAVSLGRGPVFGVSKIWAAGTLIYDQTDTATADTITASNALLASNLTIYLGTEDQDQDPTIAAVVGINDTPAYRGQVLLVFNQFDLTPYSGRIPAITAELAESGTSPGGSVITLIPRSVGSVITDLCTEAGIEGANIDVSALSYNVQGMILANTTFRAAIEEVLTAFNIHVVRSADVLQFLPSSITGEVATLDATVDLGVAPSGIGVRVKRTRKRDYDLPLQVQVNYADVARNGEQSTQSRRRMFGGSAANNVALDLKLTLTADDAARVCDSMLYRKWVERNRYRLEAGPRWLVLDAGDTIRVIDGPRSLRIRLDRIDYGFNGQLRIEARAADAAVAVSNATGADVPVDNPPLVVVGDTTAHLLDMPALTDDLSTGMVLVGAAGAAAAWRKATIWRSQDGGTTYQLVGTLPSYTNLGETNTSLPSPPATAAATWDTVSTVDVTILKGELAGVSDTLIFSGANAAVIGNEVIQFGAATLIGPNKYRLSRLTRGRRGTEWAMTGHTSGERFVMLSSVVNVPLPLTELNAPRRYKVVPNDTDIADIAYTSFTWSGEVLRPFSPVQAKASRDGGQNITLTWIRRSRLGQELPSGADIPLGEVTELYSIDVLTSGGSLKRTLVSTTPEVTYTATDQTTDFGSPQASVRFGIYQISNQVGRGRVLDVTL